MRSSASSAGLQASHRQLLRPDVEPCRLFAVAAADEQQCEEGWTKFQGNCYLHFSDRETWLEAEQRCRHLSAHLASIITPEEQDFVNGEHRGRTVAEREEVPLTLLCSPTANAQNYQWIGLNDRTVQNDFRWTDGTPLVSGLVVRSSGRLFPLLDRSLQWSSCARILQLCSLTSHLFLCSNMRTGGRTNPTTTSALEKTAW